MYNNLFLYEDYIHLVYDDGTVNCITTDNRAMHNRVIKIHQGVDNKILFRTYNRDRKVQQIQHKRVRARLVNPENSELVLEKYLDHLPEKGVLRLDVLESDIVNLSQGFYKLVITAGEDLVVDRPGHEQYTPFFTDTDNSADLDVEITGQVSVLPRPSVEVTEWTPLYSQEGYTSWYSSALPSGRIYSYTHSLHTLSIQVENYKGTIELWGSLEDVPGSNLNGFFPIAIAQQQTSIEFTGETVTVPLVLQANFLWLKIVKHDSKDNEGRVVRILSRS